MSDQAHDAAMAKALDELQELFDPAFRAYGAEIKSGEPGPVDPDPGGEPPDKDDEDGDGIIDLPQPTFRDKVTGRGIRIFHTDLGISGIPSGKAASLGVEAMKNLTQGNFLDGSKQIGLPDRSLPPSGRVEKVMAGVSTSFCTVDIERWWPNDHSGTKPLDDKALANYIEVSKRVDRSIQSGRMWGWYSTAPQRAYFAPVRGGSAERDWKAANDKAAAMLELADFIAPSLYTFSSVPDQDDWQKYARGNIAEALRIGAGKPVLPYLWPFWHVKGTEAIDRVFMLKQYETCIDAGASGVVIFITSGNRKTAYGTAHTRYFDAIGDLINKRLEKIG